MNERMELYLVVILTLMYLGCFLTVVSVRERSEESGRWLDSTATKRRLPAEGKTL